MHRAAFCKALLFCRPLEGQCDPGPSFIFYEVFAAFGVVPDIAKDLVRDLHFGVQAEADALGVELGRARAEHCPVDRRDRRDDGGIIIDIDTDEIVAKGLSMPHSPRVYEGKLWVANSGSGEIGWIDQKTKKFKPVAFCPGFIRGLSFVDGYAVVTLSKPRYKRFDGLELATKLEEKDADPWCGVQIISLQDGSVAHWIRFDGAIQELFDVCVLPGVRDALTVAPHSAEFNNFVTFEDLVPALQKEDA